MDKHEQYYENTQQEHPFVTDMKWWLDDFRSLGPRDALVGATIGVGVIEVARTFFKDNPFKVARGAGMIAVGFYIGNTRRGKKNY